MYIRYNNKIKDQLYNFINYKNVCEKNKCDVNLQLY